MASRKQTPPKPLSKRRWKGSLGRSSRAAMWSWHPRTRTSGGSSTSWSSGMTCMPGARATNRTVGSSYFAAKMMGDRQGYFISLEGLDGAGKSTQVAALVTALRGQAQDVVVVRPADTEVGETVRGFLLQHEMADRIDPWCEALLFIAG